MTGTPWIRGRPNENEKYKIRPILFSVDPCKCDLNSFMIWKCEIFRAFGARWWNLSIFMMSRIEHAKIYACLYRTQISVYAVWSGAGEPLEGPTEFDDRPSCAYYTGQSFIFLAPIRKSEISWCKAWIISALYEFHYGPLKTVRGSCTGCHIYFNIMLSIWKINP